VGILVDDATVTIENIERHLQSGGTLEDGILKGAGEIALPALVSTCCICIVFVPMFLLVAWRVISLCHWLEEWYLRCWLPIFCPHIVPTLVMYLSGT